MVIDTSGAFLALVGIAFLGAALLPPLLVHSPFSFPMVYVAAGLGLGWLWPEASAVDPLHHGALVERLTELTVIVSLISAGLKLDRALGWRSWLATWRLLLVAMPLSILAVAAAGHLVLGLSLAAALLLGAALAPTDPVLASSVQVGPPGEGTEDEARFALTSEAGLNDGLAFPFVNLAIVLAVQSVGGRALAEWFAVDVVWQIAAGVLIGALVGQAIARLVFRHGRVPAVDEGFLAIALTLVAYGLAEVAHGYGFLAVFAAGLAFRRFEHDHERHRMLHRFAEQTERLLMSLVLLAFGAALAGGLLAPLGCPGVAVAVVLLVAIRPLAALVALVGVPMAPSRRAVVAVFGIRGVGAFYYLAYGLNHVELPADEAEQLWATAGLVVLLSIVAHGLTAERATRRLRL